jgi:carboxyl-terminal processing protease
MTLKNIKRTALIAIVFIGALLLSPPGFQSEETSLLRSAHAGFFSNELEVFEEVIDLVAERYVYPPDFKKLYAASIEQMLATVKTETLSLTDRAHGKIIVGKTDSMEYQLNFDSNHNMGEFKRVYHFLLNEFPDKFSESDFETAALIGLMNSLDAYSQYLDKSSFDKSMRDTEGKYGGLGMVVTIQEGKLKIVRVMRNGPAQRAGIMPEDHFLEVSGKDVQKLSVKELADNLRGYPNTKVSFTLFRPSDKTEQKYNLTREIISVETVDYRSMPDKIAYLKISSFSKQTNDQLKEALAQAKKEDAKGFIIDLRDNPGGLLNQSVKVSSHFLHRSRMIVYTQGRAKNDYKEYRAQYKKNLHDKPVVILVNRFSASASEIVAGALRDSGKALIIGENSYGKGSVQTIFRISDGTGLRLTTSKYYTPSGTDISEHGIVPEINIVKEDHFDENHQSLKRSIFVPKTGLEPLMGITPFVQVREKELIKYLNEKVEDMEEEPDASLRFAQLLLKNITVANKKQTLRRAREIAANIVY